MYMDILRHWVVESLTTFNHQPTEVSFTLLMSASISLRKKKKPKPSVQAALVSCKQSKRGLRSW